MKFIKYTLVLSFLVIAFASQSSAQWVNVTYPDISVIKSIAAKDTNLFISGYQYQSYLLDGTYRSTDNGTSWNKLNVSFMPMANIFFYGGKICMCGYFSSVYVSSDNGINWESIGFSIDGQDGLIDIYYVATNGKNFILGSTGSESNNIIVLYISYDNGAHWNRSGFGLKINDIAVVGSNYIVGTNSGPYLSLDDAASWNLVDEGMTNDTVNTFAVSGSNLFAGTNDGVYFSTNKGVGWTAASKGLTNTHINALGVNGANVYAGTNNGFFLSTNNGASWTPVNGGLTDSVISKIAVCKDYVFAVTPGNKVWRRSVNEITSVEKTPNIAPADFSLSQNYPNPFNPTTKIEYKIEKAGFVSLKIYNAIGAEIATLVNQEKLPGSYSVTFDGKNLPSGVYFYRLTSDKSESVHKMCLVK